MLSPHEGRGELARWVACRGHISEGSLALSVHAFSPVTDVPDLPCESSIGARKSNRGFAWSVDSLVEGCLKRDAILGLMKWAMFEGCLKRNANVGLDV